MSPLGVSRIEIKRHVSLSRIPYKYKEACGYNPYSISLFFAVSQAVNIFSGCMGHNPYSVTTQEAYSVSRIAFLGIPMPVSRIRTIKFPWNP